MKQTVSLILRSLALGTAFPTFLHSQSAGGGAPAAKNSKSAAATRMDLVRIQSGSLKSAVAGLKEQVEAMNLPALNVIFGAATTDLQVPNLQVRHVAGADALRLLCASVDCEMEPIYSERQMVEGHMVEYVIGYQINARNPRPRINYTRATATTFGSMGGVPGARSISKPKPPTQPGGLGLYGYSSSKRATKVSDGDSYAGGAMIWAAGWTTGWTAARLASCGKRRPLPEADTKRAAERVSQISAARVEWKVTCLIPVTASN